MPPPPVAGDNGEAKKGWVDGYATVRREGMENFEPVAPRRVASGALGINRLWSGLTPLFFCARGGVVVSLILLLIVDRNELILWALVVYYGAVCT